MRRLLFLLLLAGSAYAQCSITTFVSGTTIQSAPMNANFASLNACKATVFSGTTLPGSVATSKLGDLYLNKTSGLTYQCFKPSGICTSVAPNNWVQLGSGGGGSGTVTVVGGGNLTGTALATGGGAQTIQTPSATATLDSAGNIIAKSFASNDTTHSGGSLYSGLTSGSVMLAVADVAGTPIVYVLPSTNGTSGQFLKDNGVVACPTLAAGSPTVCHQTTWASAGGGGSGCVPSGSSGQILIDNGAGGCTSATPTISGSTITGNVTGTSGSTTGNAATATALAANPVDCAASRYATTIAANGDLTCAQVSLTAGVTATLPVANGGTGITSLGTGVAAALGANVSGTGSICLDTGSACAGGGSSNVIGMAFFDGVSSITNLTVKGVISNITRTSAGLYNVVFSPNQSNYTASILANSGTSVPFTVYINTVDTTPPAAGFQFATTNINTGGATDSPLVMVTIFKIP